MNKTCNACHQLKSFESFHKSPTNKDGRQGHCKQCHSAKMRGATPEQKERRALKAKLRMSCPEIRSQRKEYLKSWKASSIFQRIARHTNFRKTHRPETRVAAIELWRIAHKQRLICPYSGLRLTRDTMSLDHIIPLSKGGLNIPENIQLVHKWVNLMKLDQSETEFLAMCRRVSERHRGNT